MGTFLLYSIYANNFCVVKNKEKKIMVNAILVDAFNEAFIKDDVANMLGIRVTFQVGRSS